MQESKSTLLFRAVDYRVFKDGYLFKLADNRVRSGYKLAFVPFDLHPSVLMLDFLMADTKRGASINNDLISMLKSDLYSDTDCDFVVFSGTKNEYSAEIDGALQKFIGDKQSKDVAVDSKALMGSCERDSNIILSDTTAHRVNGSDKEGELIEISDSTRIHNRKKLNKVAKVDFMRDSTIRSVKHLHTEHTTRLDRGKAVLDETGTYNRTSSFDLDILDSDSSVRTSSFDLDILDSDSSVRTSSFDLDILDSNSSVRTSSFDLDILDSDSSVRTSSFVGVSTGKLHPYLRPYLKDAHSNGNSIIGERDSVFKTNTISGTVTGNRDIVHSLLVNFENEFATRDISRGFTCIENSLAQYLRVQTRSYLDLTPYDLSAYRNFRNYVEMNPDKKLVATRNNKMETLAQDTIRSIRQSRHNANVIVSLSATMKVRQHPTLMTLSDTGNRLDRYDTYLQVVSDVARDITNSAIIKTPNSLMFEREVSKSVELLRNKLHGYREQKKNGESQETIEKTFISAYRDVFNKAHSVDGVNSGNRIYLVNTTSINTQQQGIRKYDNVTLLSDIQQQGIRKYDDVALLSDIQQQGIRKYDSVTLLSDIQQGSRKITKNAYSESENCDNQQAIRDISADVLTSTHTEYSRDNKTGIYLPTEQQQAYRSHKDTVIGSSTETERICGKDTVVYDQQVLSKRNIKDATILKEVESDRVVNKKTHLSDLLILERNVLRDTLVSLTTPYIRDNVQSADIEYLEMYTRLSQKIAHIRDEWLDILVNGGELWEGDVLKSLLMDDMLFGELLDSPAWIEEYTILSDPTTPKIGIITANFLEGTKNKIQALIDSGILVGSHEGDVPGEIISINYDALQLEKTSSLDDDASIAEIDSEECILKYPDLMADRTTIPSNGWLDNLTNPFGHLDIKSSVLGTGSVNGSKHTIGGQALESEYIATRPDKLSSHIGEVIAPAERLTKYGNMDEGESLATRTDSLAVIETDNTMGESLNRGGTLIGSIKNLLGTARKKATDLVDKLFLGHRAESDGFKESSYTVGSKKYSGGTLDTTTKTASRTERDSLYSSEIGTTGEQLSRNGSTDLGAVEGIRSDVYATVINPEFTGSRTDNKGYIEDAFTVADSETDSATLETEMLLANIKGRLASSVVDFIFAQDTDREAESLDKIVCAVRPEIAHTLMENTKEGYLEDRAGTVQSHLLATPDKYGVYMDTSVLGRGILNNYSDDLLREGSDVENWGEGYGFGVPDDYDPLDPFNNYYPYTSDYTGYELAQAVDWTNDADFEFKKDTDIINLSTKKTSIAMPNVSGSNYKFSLDFRVSGVKDTAVDVVVRYKNENNYYVFRINGGDMSDTLDMPDNMQLYKVTYGEYTPVGYPMSPHKWLRGTWHRVEVSLLEDGDKLLIKVDDRVQYDMRGY